MASISLGKHFEDFVQAQLERGRFQNVSEVVRAGLRLLEEHEVSHAEAQANARARIQEALDDPRPSVPAEDVFSRLEATHKNRMKAAKSGA